MASRPTILGDDGDLERLQHLRPGGQRDPGHAAELDHPIVQRVQRRVAVFGRLLRFVLFLFLRRVQLGYLSRRCLAGLDRFWRQIVARQFSSGTKRLFTFEGKSGIM